MRLQSLLILLAGTGLVGTAGLTFPFWRDWVLPPPAVTEAEDHHDEEHHADEVHLSPQARKNLRLLVQPVRLTTFPRTIQVPGMVVERPGRSDFSVPAPLAGIVQSIAAVPGRTVTPGQELLTLRLLSEGLQQSQTDLFKTTRELKIVQEQKDRLAAAARSGAVPEARMIDLDNQERRLGANLQALRHDLTARGLSAGQIQDITEGRFLTETRVIVPARPALAKPRAPQGENHAPVFEVQSLNVRLGDFVQAGQTLCVLNDHQDLFIEGHAFPQEAVLLEQTVRNRWPVEADFAESADGRWPRTTDELRIEYLSSTMDAESRTMSFFLELPNQSRAYTDGTKTVRVWRFRPGQRVRLRVPIEQLKDVFVLPPAAVVREGPEAYVFRQNGDLFHRCPVHVVYEDSRAVVLANDGSIGAGQYIAHNGAAAMNRILKVHEGGEGHDHDHGH